MASNAQQQNPDESSLTDILDRLLEAGGNGSVSINDVLAEFQGRSLGVWLTLFGVVAALPVIGAIPGISILVAALILIAIIQTLLIGGKMRVPGALGQREIDDDELKDAVEKSRPWAGKIDRFLKTRLTFLIHGQAAETAIAMMAGVLALSMIPLAVVPWGVQAPATGIVALGLALIGRDGLFALIGYLCALVTIVFGLWIMP